MPTLISDRPGSNDRWRWLDVDSPELISWRAASRVSSGDVFHARDIVRIDPDHTYRVERVGYRLTPDDFTPHAHELLRQAEVHAALETLRKHTGARGHRFQQKFLDTLRVGLAAGQRYGGPHRGLWLYKPLSEPNPEGHEVLSKRVVRLGVREPGGGGGEDYESPRLAHGLSLVLLNLAGWGEIPAMWCSPVLMRRWRGAQR